LSIYDIDFDIPSNLPGIYASVKRFVGADLKSFYDVFYSGTNTNPYQPSWVLFETARRQLTTSPSADDRFEIAEGSPFYFVWLPDPSVHPDDQPALPSSTTPINSPRIVYEHMSRISTLQVTIPVFPATQL
ncbi:MAG: hypothetical protein AAF226_19255, partial [Verrucomicrobiota bacterium]